MKSVTRIGVLTSGGDAQGMNAAVRAVVRTALQRRPGGLCHLRRLPGHGRRRRAHPPDELGFGRRDPAPRRHDHRHRPLRRVPHARRAACKPPTTCSNIGIDGLVVIGGDGSLTGANIFRQEWPDLLERAGRSRTDRARKTPPSTPTCASSGWSARSTTICSAPT